MTDEEDRGVTAWLHTLLETHALTRKEKSVVDLLSARPRLASYGSIREVAEQSHVSVGTVTRTAKALGFSGWITLQAELRTVYIASLSMAELGEHRPYQNDSPAYAWINRDRDNLSSFLKTFDPAQLARTARVLSDARRIFVVALGSHHGLGYAFAHSASVNGYDVRLLTEELQVLTAIALLEPGDTVIVISFWRLYETNYLVIQACSEKGIPLVLFAENVTHDVEEQCEICIRVPAEGLGAQSSLTVAISAMYAVLFELNTLNPEKSARSIERVEREWRRFGTMHSY